MATLEAIRGGGGSIRVGTVGTISSLMTRELESSKSASFRRASVAGSLDHGYVKPRRSVDGASSSGLSIGSKNSNPDVVRKTRGHDSPCAPALSATTPRAQKQKTPLEDVGNSTVRQAMSKKSPDFAGKARRNKQSSQIPMLGSENIQLEKTPIRNKPMKKGLNIVDIVDINCGNPSLSNRLKKLGFSKLSQSFM